MNRTNGESTVKKVLPLVKRSTIGIVGFILSPLSWWNDAFVNFPLAFGFAWATGKLISLYTVVHSWLFVGLFTFGYFLTNLAGFLMLHFSIFYTKKGREFSIKKQVVVSVLYSLVIILFFRLDICNPEKGCKVFPSWVVP
jgi:hypothetical protein